MIERLQMRGFIVVARDANDDGQVTVTDDEGRQRACRAYGAVRARHREADLRTVEPGQACREKCLLMKTIDAF